MAISYINSAIKQSSNTNSVTTDPFDTTNATLLAVGVSAYYAVGIGSTLPTDSKSNTWTKLTAKNNASNVDLVWFVCLSPSSVGSGHTFSWSKTGTYPAIVAMAFSGTDTAELVDQQANNSGSGSSLTTGSVTPTTHGQLLLALVGTESASNDITAIGDGFTLAQHAPDQVGAAFGIACGYFIQTTAAAKNPPFTFQSSQGAAAVIATFKAAAAPPDTTPPSDVTNLATTKISNSQVDIDSDAATDNVAVAGYQTQVSADGGSTWNTLSATTKAVSFVAGDTYFPTAPGTYSLTFRRKAFDTASTPNYSNNWSNIPTAVSITIPVSPPVASFTLSNSTVVVGGTITLTDTSTGSPTSRQWKLDEENLATTTPYALDTTGLEIGTHTIDLNASNAGGSDDAEQQTFEVVESFLAEYFEKLEICKLFNITDIDLALPLLEADFGDGYGAGVLSGKSSGLQRWTISADPILDLTDYNIDFIVDGEPQTDTPLNYFWEFFRRHIALGNKPFYFVEPRTGRKFLASFVEPRLSLKVFTKAVYGTGVQIKQRRFTLEGLEFRESDGSVNE